MRLFSKTLLILVTCAITENVFAECAWVLWWEERHSSHTYRTADAKLPGGKGDTTSSQSWNLLGAYTSNAECRAQQTDKITSMLEGWRQENEKAKFGVHKIDHVPGGNIISKTSDFSGEFTSHYYTSFRYMCPPDTIDPRGIESE